LHIIHGQPKKDISFLALTLQLILDQENEQNSDDKSFPIITINSLTCIVIYIYLFELVSVMSRSLA
jgi:hypothetical protein